MMTHPRTVQVTPAPAQRARVARFAAVGLTGVAVNLGALHLLAGVLGAPELLASAVAIEASILSNFLLNDRFTFADRRAGTGAGRLLRYHAVSLVGFVIQLGTFALLAAVLPRLLGRPELGNLRLVAQGAGIGLAFAWSWMGSSRFAWSAPAGLAEELDALPAAPRPFGARLAPALFAALLVLHLAPIWLVPWFPTQDGPLHLENVLALMQHGSSPLLQHWYLANWGAQPNWLTQALAAGLLEAFSPVTTEKLILSGYTVLFMLGFRAVLPRGTRGWWASLAGFPFVHAYPFHMGFWNFIYGMALALLVVGFWWRARGRLGGWRFAAFAGASVLLFLAHSVAFGGALIAAGGLLLLRGVLSLRRARRVHDAWRPRILRAYLTRAGALALAASPGVLLFLAWTVAHRDRASARIPFFELAAKLATGYSLVSIDRREVFLGAAVTLVLFVTGVHLVLARAAHARRVRAHDGWLLAAAGFAFLYFAIPDVVAAGAHVSDRLALFALVSVAAWIGSGSAPPAAVRRSAVALALIAVAALAVRFEKQRELSGYVGEFVSAKDVVGEGRVILPLALAPNGPRDAYGRRLGYRIKPFLHAGAWIVAENGGVDLKNSQANTDHCPVRFPPERNPFRTIAASLGRMEASPPCVDLRSPPDAREIDYVLVWGATRENLDTPCGAALAADLAARFDPVYLSAPRGMLEVWRPRGHRVTARN